MEPVPGVGRDRSEIPRMQDGVRAWVLRSASGGRSRGMLSTNPRVLLSAMCAAACAPVVITAAGVGGVAAAGAGVLASLGGGTLSGILTTAFERSRDRGEPDPDDLERKIAQQIDQILEAGDATAAALRAEIAAVLAEIDAGGTALRAAIETGDDRIRDDLIAALDFLSARFAEMAFLLQDVSQAAANIQKSLDEQGANVRAIAEQNARQSTEIRLVRENLAAIAERSKSSFADQEGRQVPRWACGSPYRGLVPYGEDNAEVFYGRERLTADLVVRLAGQTSRGGLIVVTGASGAGKSSLLRAGLMPALARGLQLEGSERWPRTIMTPTKDPLSELAAHLAALGGGYQKQIRDGLAQEPGHARWYVRQAVLAAGVRRAQAGAAAADGTRLVLVVDQFEQIFTLNAGPAAEAHRRAFIAALHAAACSAAGSDDEPAALVVVSVRGDFWDRCAGYPELAAAMRDGQFMVGPMTESDLRLAVTAPGDAAGLRIDAGLVDTILGDLRAASGDVGVGALPLLSQAMLLTWENREDDRLTSHGYGQTGGVSRAVQTSADAVYDGLPADQKLLARELLRRMTVTDRDGRLARRPVSRADLHIGWPEPTLSKVDEVLEAFADRRLIVLDESSAQISHDALLIAWPRLRGWLEEDQASWILYGQLADDAMTWRDSNRDGSFLYRGAQLAAVRQATAQWAGNPDRYPVLAETQRDFLDTSERAASRSARQRRAVSTSLVLLLVAAITAAGLAVVSARNAGQRGRIAASGELAAESEDVGVADPGTAALLATAAQEISATPQARESMLNVIAEPERARLNPGGQLDAVAFSPDGKILATAGEDAQLWDVATHHQIGAPIQPIKLAGTDLVSELAFSPDGKILATAGEDAQLWDVATHHQIGAPIQPDGLGVSGLAFSPNGQILATVSSAVQLWNVASHDQIGRPITVGSGSSAPEAVAFSPNGQVLATANEGGAVQLWNVATQRQIGATMTLPGGVGFGMAFSPDGRTLATADGDGTARLWDVATQRQIGLAMSVSTGNDFITGLAFSPNGQILATASQDGIARLWDVASQQQLGDSLSAGTGDMSGLAFSPDGNTLATVSSNGTARLWNVNIYRQFGMPMPAAVVKEVWGVAFSPSGKVLATAAGDGTARLWDVHTQRQIGTTMLASGRLNGLAFDPDGQILATAGDNGAQLWDVATHRQVGPSVGGTAEALAFSPNGKILATATANGYVELWNVADQRQIGSAMPADPGSLATGLSFNSDGQLLATVGIDGVVRLWNVADQRQVGAPITAGSGLDGIAFRPGSDNILATAGVDGTIRFWNVDTRSQIGTPFNVPSYTVEMAFSPDGQLLATADGDGTVRLWDVDTQREIGEPITTSSSGDVGGGIGGGLNTLAFSPDGETLATGWENGTAVLVNVAFPHNLLSAMCSIADGPFPRQEWDSYAPTQPYQQVCQ
jgi:WD40 repeat protein